MTQTIATVDELGLQRIARLWIEQTPPPATVFLSGELGVGKSTFVRSAIVHLGFSGAVKSPTFSLLESYNVSDRRIYHMDLYRLHDADELEFIGFRDLLVDADYLFIEWPERASDYLPAATSTIQIDYDRVGRKISLSPEIQL